MPVSYTLEDAADDLLMVFSQAQAGLFPSAEEIGDAIANHAVAGVDDLNAYTARKASQTRGARAGFQIGVDAMGRVAATNFALAGQLLEWAAARSGLSPAEVIAEVLAADEEG